MLLAPPPPPPLQRPYTCRLKNMGVLYQLGKEHTILVISEPFQNPTNSN